MKEQNERKQKEKRESKGLEVMNRRPISTGNPINNQNANTNQNYPSMSAPYGNSSQITGQQIGVGNYPQYNQNISQQQNYSNNQMSGGMQQSVKCMQGYANDLQLGYLTKQQFDNINNLIKTPSNNSQNYNQNFQPPSNIPQGRNVTDYTEPVGHQNIHQPNTNTGQKITQQNQPEDKQADKQKKMDYQNILRRQMEEKKERQEEEKRKRQEEEKKIEEQYRIMIEKEKEKEKEEERQRKLKMGFSDNQMHVVTSNKTGKRMKENITQNQVQVNEPNSLNNAKQPQSIPLSSNNNNNVNYHHSSGLNQEYLNYKQTNSIPTIQEPNPDFYNHPHFENNPYDAPNEQFIDQGIYILTKGIPTVQTSILSNNFKINPCKAHFLTRTTWTIHPKKLITPTGNFPG